jgi:hypothetical protein
MKEGECEHEWQVKIDSQHHNDFGEEVVCTKCGVHGEKNIKTGEVFWPVS